MRRIADRDRRAIVVAAVAIPAIFGVRLVASFAVGWNAQAEARAEHSLHRLAQARALAAAIPGGHRTLDSLRSIADSYRLSERAETLETQQMGLARVAVRHAAAAEVNVESTDVLAPQPMSPTTQLLSVRIRGVCTSRGLEGFLRRVRMDSTAVRVSALSVIQNEPLAAPESAEALRIDVTLVRLASIQGQGDNR